jgi:plastocyanin
MTTPPLDRFPNVSDRFANHHALTPQVAKIKAGGTVNFIIGGFHQVLVYDNGTQPGDIDTSILVPVTTPPPPGPLLIADPTRRIYRGLDPSTLSGVQDRVEVVHFANPGTYLVICGVLPHFQQGMYGFVKVTPK